MYIYIMCAYVMEMLCNLACEYLYIYLRIKHSWPPIPERIDIRICL